MKQIAYSYFRVSTPRQGEEGTGIERQEQNAIDWCQKNGYELDNSLRDVGKSAFSGSNKKGALGLFLNAIENGDIPNESILLIEAIDRLSREDVLDIISLITKIVNAGVRIITIEDNTEYSRKSISENASLLYVLVGKAQQAHNYSALLSKRVYDGKNRSRKNNIENKKPITKMCPFWLKVCGEGINKHYEVIEDRAKIIHDIFTYVLNGLGRDSIVRKLNTDGIPPFSKNSKGWHASYIQKLITNRALIGEFQPTSKRVENNKTVIKIGEPIKDFYPIAIDKDLFFKVNQTHRPSGRHGKVYRNILTGLVKCAHCGATMTQLYKGERRKDAKHRVDDRETTWLVCDNVKRHIIKDGNPICDRNEYISYHLVENEAINIGAVLAKSFEFNVSVNYKVKNINDKIAELMDEKNILEKRTTELSLKIDTNTSVDLLLSIINKAQSKIDDINADLDKLRLNLDKISVANDGSYSELLDLFKKANKEKDITKRYTIRAKLHMILLKYIDRIDIDVLHKRFVIWANHGSLMIDVKQSRKDTYIINKDKMYDVYSDMKEIPTPKAILQKYMELQNI